MKQPLTKYWHDPVWSKVIAGLILAIGSAAIVYFFNLLSAIKSFVTLCIEFALSKTAVSNLLLITAGLLSIPTVVFIVLLVWFKIFPQKPKLENLTWRNIYFADIFFGLRWRWKYTSGDAANIYEVTTYCPHCDYQIFSNRTSIWDSPISFYCDSCHEKLPTFGETYPQLESKVTRHIAKKIRNGTWKTPNSI
jgi:hypothetical protein